MKKVLFLVILFFGVSAQADENKRVELSWSSEQQVCDCSLKKNLAWIEETNKDGSCKTDCEPIFPNDLSAITEEDLSELVCDVARFKFNLHIAFNPLPACDDPDVQGRVVDYDEGELEEGNIAGYKKEYGEALFHVKCTIAQERICEDNCIDITTEKKVKRKSNKVEVIIFKGTPEKEEKKEDEKPNKPVLPGQVPLFRPGSETIG